VEAASRVKAQLSVLVDMTSGQPKAISGLINVSADGVFVAGSDFVPKDVTNLKIVLSDGRTASISSQTTDLATGLVFLKTNINNVAVADFASSKQATTGEKVAFVNNSVISFSSRVQVTYVTSNQDDVAEQLLSANSPRRSFGVQSLAEISAGSAIVNLQGQVLGYWTGGRLVSADVIKQIMSSYFSTGGKITNPNFGFSYRLINKTEASLMNSLQGALIVQVDASSKHSTATVFPAATAGLAPGDLIISLDNSPIDETHPLEEILQNYKPGDSVKFNILRNGKNLSLSLIVGALQ
jgi:serine protease DegQ